jgi:hypothetical protein
MAESEQNCSCLGIVLRRWWGTRLDRYPGERIAVEVSPHQFRDAWEVLGIDPVVLSSECEEIDHDVPAKRSSGDAG